MNTPLPPFRTRLKNRALVLVARVGCAVLMAAALSIAWVVPRLGNFCSALARFGSRVARSMVALSEFGKRHC